MGWTVGVLKARKSYSYYLCVLTFLILIFRSTSLTAGEAPTVDGTPLTGVSLNVNEDIVRDLFRFRRSDGERVIHPPPTWTRRVKENYGPQVSVNPEPDNVESRILKPPRLSGGFFKWNTTKKDKKG